MTTHNIQTLANGLKLILIPMPHVKSATVLVMVGAGSRYESKEINGLSHFLEHMAFKGSKKRPTAQMISSTIDAIGGEFNAFTGKDHTGFYIKARASDVPLLIDVLSDMILNPILSADEIEREKGVIIEEIHMYEDTPMRHIGDIYEELLYGNTPLGWDTAGKPEIIRSIKRDHFVDYIDRHYRPNNAVMIVAGGITKDELRITNLVKKQLNPWQKKITSAWENNSPQQVQPAVKVQFKDTQQAHMAIGVRAYSMLDPRRFALQVLATIMGGGMSSRLFIQVRERRGLAYYVHASADQYLDVGAFTTQAGVDVKRIDEAIKVIIAEYLGAADGTFAVKAEELTKAKEYLKGKSTLELEDSRSVAAFYGSQELLKRSILTPDELMAKYDSVTVADIHAVAKNIFVREKLNLAIIGPFKDEERFRKLLN